MSLSTRLILYIGTCVLFFLVTVFYLNFQAARRDAYAQMEARANALADEVGYAFEVLVKHEDDFSMRRVVEQTATIAEVKAVGITDRDGRYIFHNQEDWLGKTIDHHLLAQVIESEHRQVKYGADEFLVVQPLHGESYAAEYHSDVIGAVTIAMDLAPVNAHLQKEFLITFLGTLAFVILLSMSLMAIINLLILRPIKLLSTATRQLVDGNWQAEAYTKQLEIERRDEISGLARAFSNMAAQLRQTLDGLEQRVADRTHDLEQRNRQLLALQSAGVVITSSLDLQEVLNTVTQEMAKLLEAPGCAIFEWQQETDSISLLAEYGSGGWWDETSGARVYPLAKFPLTKQVLVKRCAEQMTISQADIDPADLAYMQTARLKTLLMLPMIFQDQVVGLVELRHHDECTFTDQAVSLAQLLANQAASAIENARLFEETQAALSEARNLAEALRVSEERFALAVQGSNDGIWDWDIVNNTLYWSPRLKEQMEYADDELDVDFETFESYVHSDDRERISAALEAHLKDRVPYEVETRLRTKSGEYRWFRERGQAVWDEDGRPLRMAGSSTDITERKQVEEALRISEERFALAVQGANDGVWDWDITNNTLYWSPRLKELLGYADDDLDVDFDTFDSFLHPGDKELVAAAIEAHLEHRVPYDVEQRLHTKSGEYRWFQARGQAIWDEAGQSLRMVGFTTDITERVRAVEALQESEKRYRSLFEDSPISLWEEDFSEVKAYLDGLQASGVKDLGAYFKDHPEAVTHCTTLVKVVDVNKATLKMYEAEDKNELLTNLGVVMGNEAHQVFTEELIVLAGGQTRFESETINHTLMGDRKHIVLTCQVAPICEETWSKVLISIQDITELKRAEEQLQHYAARLERSNRELEEFAYVASHDLQEPLRKIQAFGDRLKTKHGQTLSDQGCDYLGRMQNAAARMQTLINGLLTYSRVTTKAQPFVLVDLAQVTQEVMSDLEVRIQELGGRVDVENLPHIEADPTQMRQLLQNLVANALKFHRQDQPPVVKVYAGNASHNGLCQIFVEDNGIGFDEKYLDRIFQVFQRLHGRDKYEGSGVGLATCRKIVERHKGGITARSVPGQGATFIVTLPVRQPQGEVDHPT